MKLNRKFLSFYYDGVEEFPDYVIEPKKNNVTYCRSSK